MSVPSFPSRDGRSGPMSSLRLFPLPSEASGPPAPGATQPRPIGVLLCDIPCGTTLCTAIARVWKEGDPARCRLCPTCSADANNVCLVVAPCHVPDAAAALFALRGDETSEARNPAPRDEGARPSGPGSAGNPRLIEGTR